MGEVLQLYSEYHADYDDVVKVKSRRRVSIWRMIVFCKRK